MDGGLGDATGQRKGVEQSSLARSVQTGAHAQCLERPGCSRGRVWGSSLRLRSVSRLVGTSSAGLLSLSCGRAGSWWVQWGVSGHSSCKWRFQTQRVSCCAVCFHLLWKQPIFQVVFVQ